MDFKSTHHRVEREQSYWSADVSEEIDQEQMNVLDPLRDVVYDGHHPL